MNEPKTCISRTMAIKIDIITADIKRIWFDNPSDYIQGKMYLHEASLVLYKDPKKAYKLLEKTKESVSAEASVAYEYNQMKSAVIQSSDREVGNLNRMYIESLSRGDFKAARKAVDKLKKTSCVYKSRPGITMKLTSGEGGNAVFEVSNVTDHDISVHNMVLMNGSTRMVCDISYPFVVHKCASIKVTAYYDGGIAEVSGHIEYEDEGIIKQGNPFCMIKEESGED